MSAFSDKLHALLTKLKGGEELAQHEVETMVEEFINHVTPVIETVKNDVLTAIDEAAKQARADVEKLAEKLKGDVSAATDAPQAVSTAGETSDGETSGVTVEAPSTPAE